MIEVLFLAGKFPNLRSFYLVALLHQVEEKKAGTYLSTRVWVYDNGSYGDSEEDECCCHV